jgi:hypothetical protein
MSKYGTIIIYLFLAVIAILVIGHFFPELRKDGFTADRVPSGEYPHEVDEPLLSDTYPKKTTDYGVIFRDNNSENNSKLYPVAAANESSYDQSTNNVRDWLTPDNGSCTPASMCGALYLPKTPEEYIVPEPLPLNIPDKRVGFYASIRR